MAVQTVLFSFSPSCPCCDSMGGAYLSVPLTLGWSDLFGTMKC